MTDCCNMLRWERDEQANRTSHTTIERRKILIRRKVSFIAKAHFSFPALQSTFTLLKIHLCPHDLYALPVSD